jgi:type IX secretion system PorP/SprF family membrane protein
MHSFFKPFHKIRGLIFYSVSCVLLVLHTNDILSQDLHFSLYEYSPLFLNPANTGNFNGDWRIAGVFRNQPAASSDPFRTIAFSFDSRLSFLQRKIGFGVLAVNDESGLGGLSFNKFYASLSYKQEINKNFFILGVQAGYVIGSVNSWSNWNYDVGDFSAPNGETGDERASYADINVGLNWKRSIHIVEPEIGVSFSHLNKPNVSFYESGSKEDIKLSVNAGIKVNFTDKLFIKPAFLYVSKADNMTMLGTTIGLNLQGSKSSVKQFSAGAFLRNGLTNDLNTLVFMVTTTINRLDVGFSYDMNTGVLGESIGNTGAFEISIIYKSISTVLNSYSIPCERF